MFGQKFVPQDLAGLATPSHGVDVQIRKVLSWVCFRLIAVGEDLTLILKYSFQEVVLNVLPPEWFAIVFLEMLDLVANVYRAVQRASGWWFLSLS